MALLAGSRIGPYELLELLGTGGMGEVYRARDPRLGREVAIKVLPERFAHSADRVARFEREARAAGSLSHPNVLTVFDVGSQDGIHYLVSELLEGETMQAFLRFERPSLRQSLLLALEVARGLACAHQAGILHRDLKPENLFLTRAGPLKILDFGLAKLVQPDDGASPLSRTVTRDTDTGGLLGTAAYMSPEQIRDESLDERSDIFAVGAIFYELLSQRPAFTGTSRSDVFASVLRDEPPALAELGVLVPAGVETVVRSCLEKRREKRLGSARELAAALQALLESLDPPAVVTGRGLDPTELRSRRPLEPPGMPPIITTSRRGLRRAAVVAAVVAAAVGLGLLARWRAPTRSPAANSLAVMYFENLSDRTDADNLARMLAGLLTTDLAGSEGLQVVSSQRLYDITRQLGKAEGDPDRAVATDVARRAGATRMVLGQVVTTGSRMVATVELVEVESGRRLGSYRAEGTSPQHIFSMAEQLGTHLRANLTGRSHQPGAVRPMTSQLTASAEAYRAYIRGEAFLQRWEIEKAADEFRKALTIDPEFALAHYWFSLAATWTTGGGPKGRAAAERAAALKDKLLPIDRDLVQANLLYITGRPSEAIPFLESVLGRDAEHKEALYLLSECYVHSPLDADPRRSSELMERLLALDPEYHVVYSHLAFAYAQLGEFAKAYERLDAWESKEPVIVRDTRAVVSAFEGQLDESLRWSEQSEGHGIFTRSVFCLAAGRWDLAESIVRTHGSRTDDLGWILRLTRAYLHVYRGELGKAETAFRQFLPAQLEQDQATLGGLWASTLASLAELSSLKADHRAAGREAERALTVQPQGPFSLYFAGLYATRAGEIPTGERHLQTLEKVLSVARGPLVPHYRDALAAEIALARGRASEARPLLENAIGSGKLFYDAMTYSPAPAFREGLARTYLAIGDNEKAAEALQALVSNRWEGFSDPVRCVRALYTLGKLRLELGDRARGRELLEKFLKHWGNADWDIPEVRSARALLAASTSPQ